MKVRELMATQVTTVGPETPLKEVAALLAVRGVSGVPVVDDRRRVLGVVSETDVLGRIRGAGRARFDLLDWAEEWNALQSGEKLRAHRAGEAMTRPAITVDPDTPVARAAALMVDRGVNRLPVVNEAGELVGIVSRADLVRSFARSDAELEQEIGAELLESAPQWCAPGDVRVVVDRGDVRLTGTVASAGAARLLVAAVERVPGVLSVEADLHPASARQPTSRGGAGR